MISTRTVLIALGITLVLGLAVGAMGMKGCTPEPQTVTAGVVRDTVYLPSEPDTVIVHATTKVYVPREPLVVEGNCDAQIAARDSVIDALAYENWQMSNVEAEAVIDEPQVQGSVVFLMNEYLKDPQAAFQLALRSVNATKTEVVTITECQRTWWDSLKNYALAGSLAYIAIDIAIKLLSTNK